MKVDETYSPKRMTASGVLLGVGGGVIGGFACEVSGTLSLTYTDDASVIVNAIPVTAGVFLPLPFTIPPGRGVTATLATGAIGTFAVNNG